MAEMPAHFFSGCQVSSRMKYHHAKFLEKFAGSRPETGKRSPGCDVTRHASRPYEISRQYTFTVAVWITASLDDISYRPLDIVDMRRMRPAMPASQVSDHRPTVLLLVPSPLYMIPIFSITLPSPFCGTPHREPGRIPNA